MSFYSNNDDLPILPPAVATIEDFRKNQKMMSRELNKEISPTNVTANAELFWSRSEGKDENGDEDMFNSAAYQQCPSSMSHFMPTDNDDAVKKAADIILKMSSPHEDKDICSECKKVDRMDFLISCVRCMDVFHDGCLSAKMNIADDGWVCCVCEEEEKMYKSAKNDVMVDDKGKMVDFDGMLEGGKDFERMDADDEMEDADEGLEGEVERVRGRISVLDMGNGNGAKWGAPNQVKEAVGWGEEKTISGAHARKTPFGGLLFTCDEDSLPVEEHKTHSHEQSSGSISNVSEEAETEAVRARSQKSIKFLKAKMMCRWFEAQNEGAPPQMLSTTARFPWLPRSSKEDLQAVSVCKTIRRAGRRKRSRSAKFARAHAKWSRLTSDATRIRIKAGRASGCDSDTSSITSWSPLASLNFLKGIVRLET